MRKKIVCEIELNIHEKYGLSERIFSMGLDGIEWLFIPNIHHHRHSPPP